MNTKCQRAPPSSIQTKLFHLKVSTEHFLQEVFITFWLKLPQQLQYNSNGSFNILLCLKEANVISKPNIRALRWAPLRAIFLLRRIVAQQLLEWSSRLCPDWRLSVGFYGHSTSFILYFLFVKQLKSNPVQSLLIHFPTMTRHFHTQGATLGWWWFLLCFPCCGKSTAWGK